MPTIRGPVYAYFSLFIPALYPYFVQYQDTDVPEARFSYDLSPMSVTIIRKGKRFYEFLTSMCALVGGTFTVMGLLSGFLNNIFKPKKI